VLHAGAKVIKITEQGQASSQDGSHDRQVKFHGQEHFERWLERSGFSQLNEVGSKLGVALFSELDPEKVYDGGVLGPVGRSR
jgi:hypothetical protein